MDEQLRWLTGAFEDAGIEYWLESGTLLTGTRSGSLTDYDDDIDVAVWAGDLDAVSDLRPVIEDRGYHVQVRTYHGVPYKYQFLPTDDAPADDPRIVDLMVFRRAHGHAWTAQSRVRREFPVPGLGAALSLAKPLAERYAQSTAGHIELAAFPKSVLTEVLTLWIPLEYVERVASDPDLGYRVPVDVESYLTFRYDDWRTPVEEWELTDDNAIRERAPGDLVDRDWRSSTGRQPPTRNRAEAVTKER